MYRFMAYLIASLVTLGTTVPAWSVDSNSLEETEDALEDTLPLVRRANLVKQALEFWMESGDKKFVYWTEGRGRGLYLQATPIDVSSVLAERLLDRV